METLVKAWTAARQHLEAAGVDSPVIDARILLLSATGVNRMTLISEPHTPLTPEAQARLRGWLDRRAAREPVAHIVGERGFWNLILKSDARALVPRPETEVIVDLILKNAPVDRPQRVLDLGTGSGAILLALLAERPEWTGVGVDVSQEALALAADNAAMHDLGDRLTLVEGHWTDGVTGPFDVIVSNPPYIPSADIAGLDVDVRDHDPHLALDGGADGLDPYRHLFPLLPDLMTPWGLFAFEFGIGQGPDVKALADAVPGLVKTAIIKDLSDKERVLIGRRDL
ncbi:MAG: peptide chain release factor N(5)-glutamine methyltransferase [Hyphomonadaceae bacterium]|jgi:release factor glutamine methyltransferase|nr:peptide chain release factor N(5)-glutamine methyltransferase [Hyphomonadaceae bacterium]